MKRGRWSNTSSNQSGCCECTTLRMWAIALNNKADVFVQLFRSKIPKKTHLISESGWPESKRALLNSQLEFSPSTLQSPQYRSEQRPHTHTSIDERDLNLTASMLALQRRSLPHVPSIYRLTAQPVWENVFIVLHNSSLKNINFSREKWDFWVRRYLNFTLRPPRYASHSFQRKGGKKNLAALWRAKEQKGTKQS